MFWAPSYLACPRICASPNTRRQPAEPNPARLGSARIARRRLPVFWHCILSTPGPDDISIHPMAAIQNQIAAHSTCYTVLVTIFFGSTGFAFCIICRDDHTETPTVVFQARRRHFWGHSTIEPAIVVVRCTMACRWRSSSVYGVFVCVC